MNVKALSIMLYHDNINTEHNMKSICHAAVAQWKSAWLEMDMGPKLKRRKHDKSGLADLLRIDGPWGARGARAPPPFWSEIIVDKQLS